MVFALLTGAKEAAMQRLVPTAHGEHGFEAQGLDLHVKGLPKWMHFKDPANKLTKADQAKIVTGGKQQLASAKADCEKNKALGARCIF